MRVNLKKAFASLASIALAGMILPAHLAWAWDGAGTGKIASIQMVVGQPGNFEMRIALDSGNVCAGAVALAQGWLYMNEADTNYKATAALLMTAFQTQQTVTLFGTLDQNKFCKLGHVVLSR